jgi:hypothetical protein
VRDENKDENKPPKQTREGKEGKQGRFKRLPKKGKNRLPNIESEIKSEINRKIKEMEAAV